MTRRVRSTLIVLVCTLAPVAAQQAPPSPSGAAGEATIVEQMKRSYRFEADGTGRRDVFMRVKVLSDAGVQQMGQVVLGYNAATERLEIPFVRVRKPDGTSVETPASSVQDLSSPVQRVAPVYTDFRQKHVSVQSLRPGDTLEVSVITTVHTALAPGHFWTEASFENDDVVLDEQLDIDVPAAERVLLKVEPGSTPEIKESGGRRIYHWSHAHPVREKDEDKAAKAKQRPWNEPKRADVRLTTFADWAEVGAWFAALEKTARQSTPEVRAKAQQLTAGKTTELEKLEALYDYVSKEFRYVSLSLGAGRFQPRAAPDVLRDAYGDCKDKHTLLASLIDAAGMHAAPVLINTAAPIDPEFPSPSQFDHVITRAQSDGQEVWMDATSEVAPFRLLAMGLRDTPALLGDPSASRLVRTPAATPFPSRAITDVDGSIDESGALEATTVLTFRGDIEVLMRTAFRATPEAQWPKIAEAIVSQARIDGKASDLKVTNPQATKEPFVVRFVVRAPSYVSWNGRNTSLDLPLDGADKAPVPVEAGPIVVGATGESGYKLRLRLPPLAKLRPPAPVAVTRDYAEYHAGYAVSGTTLTAERTLTVKQPQIPQDRRADYQALMRVLEADKDQRFSLDASEVVTTTPGAGVSAATLNRTGYDALEAGDFAKAVDLLTRAIAADPKLSGTRVNLARAHLSLDQPKSAIDVLRAQLAVNAYESYVHFYLGQAYVDLKQYAEAEAEFRKELELNPLDKWAPGALGALYMTQRQYDKAAAAYEQAAVVNPEQSYAQIQLGKAYLNLGRTADARKAFDRAVEISPTPNTWNSVSYELALTGTDLDRALRYAESAVNSETAASRNLDVERVDARALRVVSSLAAHWDTLGWVHFAKGDLAAAEKYVSASWKLGQHSVVGDHLAQIYEKTGRTAEAIRTYAAALAAAAPADEAREHLTRLAGSKTKADQAVEQHREDLSKARTYPLGTSGPVGKTADFFVLIASPGTVEAVTFVGGDAQLRSVEAAIRKLTFSNVFPDNAPAKLVRRGIVGCGPASCSITLLLPDDARPAK